MDKDSLKAIFTARVHRYLYSKDSSDESEETHEPEVSGGEIAGTDVSSFDTRDKLLERHEEFIKSQLAVVKKIQLKGILSVSSKQSVEEPSQSAAVDDECLVKDDKVPQTRKNRKRKLKKKRRREQQLIAKKLKEETSGGDIVGNMSGTGDITYITPGDIVNNTADNTTDDVTDSTPSNSGDAYRIARGTPGSIDIPSDTNDFTDSTPSNRPTV